MNHKEGHELVNQCLTILQDKIKKEKSHYVSMDPKLGYDEWDGHFYGFEYTSQFESTVPRHEGEFEICAVMYYAESGEVLFIFDNSGHTQEINSLEDFKTYVEYN